MKTHVKFYEVRRIGKHGCLYAEAFPQGTSSMGPMTGRHATYRRCHAEDKPIIINTTIKTKDNKDRDCLSRDHVIVAHKSCTIHSCVSETFPGTTGQKYNLCCRLLCHSKNSSI